MGSPHDDLERSRQRQPLREPDRPARTGEQPALDLGQPERRLVGGDHEVAREHDLEPARDRRAVDRGDDRLREVALDEAGEATASSS